MSSQPLLLLIEDEPWLRLSLEAALRDAGFDVAEAASGTDAMALLDADASRYQAIIADIRLGPGPDGWDVAQRAREHVANLPIVYMSGDSSADWASRGVPGSVILAKPFAPVQLVTAVATLLNAVSMTPPPQGPEPAAGA